jgi:hypothetical protein
MGKNHWSCSCWCLCNREVGRPYRKCDQCHLGDHVLGNPKDEPVSHDARTGNPNKKEY